MRRDRGITRTDVTVLVLLGVMLLGAFSYADIFGWGARRRTQCMNNVRQVGLAMNQYAGEHDGRFPGLVPADAKERRDAVPAVDDKGHVSKLPARSAFAILLKMQYLTTTRVFICPESTDREPPKEGKNAFPVDYKEADLKDLLLAENQCSYGWDPTKRSNAHATCAIIADKPSADVSDKNAGAAKNNSDNHRKAGQNVWYNDGHVKWGTTSAPEVGDDPDFYLGGKDYHKSVTDAKIIR